MELIIGMEEMSKDIIIGTVHQRNSPRPRVYIGEKNVQEFFNKDKPDIEIEIEDKIYYCRHPDCFFNTCWHIDKAYDKPEASSGNRQTNCLSSWLIKNNVNCVKIEVLEKDKRLRFTKEK